MNKAEFERKIKIIMGNTSRLQIGEATSKDTQPTYKFDGKILDENKQYAVKLFAEKGVFIVWNLDHQRKNNCLGTSVRLKNNSWDKVSIGIDEVHDQYKELGKRGSRIWEKIYIVGLNYIDRFFEHLDDYMKFNTFDENAPQEIKIKNHEIEMESREKYSSKRWKRDIKFRNKVLDSYGHKCAVCRCDIEEVLQAAHEHGYEPGNTLWDDPNHGICLCANHHLMYDKGLIDFDLITHTLSVSLPKITEMSWYKEFVDIFGGRLL